MSGTGWSVTSFVESTQTEPILAKDMDGDASYKTLCPRDGMIAMLTGFFSELVLLLLSSGGSVNLSHTR